MALTSSGEISIAGSTANRSIALEFGRGATSTLSLSQLYRGGTIVPSNNTNVPASGTISLSNFYGATNRANVTVTLTSQNNFTTSIAGLTGYVAGATDLTYNIPSTVTIGSNNTTAAFTVGTFTAGDKIIINNNGAILGKGGDGPGSTGGNGSAGSPAIDCSGTVATVIINNNTGATIGGGGGAGGGGRSGRMQYASGYGYANSYNSGGGGGGGAGWINGQGGAVIGTRTSPSAYYQAAANGSVGGTQSGGSGGVGDYGHWAAVSPNYYWRGGTGGAGGGLGAAGSAGGVAYFSGQDIGGPYVLPNGTAAWIATGYTNIAEGSGGAAGNAIKGVGKYTLNNTGSVYGPQVP